MSALGEEPPNVCEQASKAFTSGAVERSRIKSSQIVVYLTGDFMSNTSLLCALMLSAFALAPEIDAVTLYATTNQGSLIRVESGAPTTIVSSVTLSGLQSGETLRGIDFRPATAQLYGFGSTGRLYRIDPVSGTATAIGAPLSPALTGTAVGFDFNPVADRIRLVTDAGENVRLQPDTGAIAATDTALAYAGDDANNGKTPHMTAAGYTNSFAGATTTTLYGIDTTLGTLVRQGSVGGTPLSPNAGQLSTVGPLGIQVTSTNGFDISRYNDAAYAALTPQTGGPSSLYTINLATGAATRLGDFNTSLQITGLAILENTGPTQDCALAGAPVINGITESASYLNSLGSGGLSSVFLSGISTAIPARAAASTDFLNNRFPQELGCIAVEINGQRAPVLYVSNSQVNIQIPSSVLGPSNVQVILNPGRSNEIRGAVRSGVVVQTLSPAFFTFDGQSIAAQSAAFAPIANASVVPGARPARPGEIVTLYASGFGPTNPAFDAGSIPDRQGAITSPFSITVGGVGLADSDILYAGVSPSSISGLYQFNIRVPLSTASGNVPVVISAGGMTTQATAYLPVAP